MLRFQGSIYGCELQLESNLEMAITSNLQKSMLEMGKEFSFVGR